MPEVKNDPDEFNAEPEEKKICGCGKCELCKKEKAYEDANIYWETRRYERGW